MAIMSPDGEGDGPGVLTLQHRLTTTDAADGMPARPPAMSAGGALAAAVVIAMIAAAIVQQGGFYPTDAFGLAVVSVVLVVATLRHSRDHVSVRVAAAVCGLTVWWLLRSIAAHRAIAFFPIGAALLGFLAGFLVVRCLGDRDRTRIVIALVSIVSATGLVGLAGVLWHVTSWAQNEGGYWQLTTPLTQPEAAAALLTITLLVGLALDLEKALVRIALCIMLAAFIATQSHWTLLALAAGVLLVPRRRWRFAWWPLATGTASGAVVIASASGHLTPSAASVLLVAAASAACWRGEKRAAKRIGAERAVVVARLALVFIAVVYDSARGTTTGSGRTASAGRPEPDRRLVWRGACVALLDADRRRATDHLCIEPAG